MARKTTSFRLSSYEEAILENVERVYEIKQTQALHYAIELLAIKATGENKDPELLKAANQLRRRRLIERNKEFRQKIFFPARVVKDAGVMHKQAVTKHDFLIQMERFEDEANIYESKEALGFVKRFKKDCLKHWLDARFWENIAHEGYFHHIEFEKRLKKMRKRGDQYVEIRAKESA